MSSGAFPSPEDAKAPWTELHGEENPPGGGTRLLDGIPSSVKLEQTRVVEAPDVAHIFYALSY